MDEIENIADPSYLSRPDHAIIHEEVLEELRGNLDSVLDSLPPLEAEVLGQRFGYFSRNRRRQTLEEIRREYDLTRERIALLESRAFKTLGENMQKEGHTHESISVEATVATCTRLSTDLIAHLQSHYDDIHKIPPNVLEHLVAEFLASWGYADVRTVGRDSSTGADVHAVLVEPNAGIKQRLFIEVKRYINPIEIDAIRTIHGAISLEESIHGWNLGMLVTTSKFRDYAIAKEVNFEHFGINLKSGDDLRDWLANYLPTPTGLWLPNPESKMPE